MRPPSYLSRYCNGSGQMERRAGSGCRERDVVSVETVSLSAVDQQQKNSVVRIVLAGGMVELYGGAVSAQLVIEKYPGLCLAKPDVFRRPHESVVSPRAWLLPGQKFYLVPRSTLIKIRQKVSREDKQENRFLHEGDIDCHDDDNFICSAKNFYDNYSICSAKHFDASKENWVDSFIKKLEKAKEMQEKDMEKPNFIPRIKKLRPRIGLSGGWQPSLSPVQEISP